jgi:hypothetical protein
MEGERGEREVDNGKLRQKQATASAWTMEAKKT